MVDNGCTVIDVVVDHPLYGQMTGQLSLASRYDVRQFVEKAKHAAPCPPSPMGFIFTTSAAPVRRRTSGSART